MKVTVAIDSFKGSLSTHEAGLAAKRGILRVYPEADVFVRPLADGGEGTVDAVVTGAGGEIRKVEVTGPLGETVIAEYGVIEGGKGAVIEMSAAAGLPLVPEDKRDPLYTTTYGVGEIIRDAIDIGIRDFIIGIGGSATNDGGVGMLTALGFEFNNSEGKPIRRGAIGLSELVSINCDRVHPALSECRFKVACDVKNPLTGEKGASAVYGPQKGATPEAVKNMDAWLKNYARLTSSLFERADEEYPGAGAAGGMGFAFLSYLCAELRSGIELVIEATGLKGYIKESDFVVTGEGRLDGQSCMGKAPVGVARLARSEGKCVIAFAGCVTKDTRLTNECGIDAYFPIVRGATSLKEAMDIENASFNLEEAAEQAFRLIRACK